MLTVDQTLLTHLTLANEQGKAEIINGEIVTMSPTGYLPNRASTVISASLLAYEMESGLGYATSDNVGFIVDLPNRQSFSPHAGFYIGSHSGMRFLEGAPVFAVEVRSENDYGKDAEIAIATKRTDYFAAGTLVVWDVDLLSSDVIRAYRSDAPNTPIIFGRGDVANAEPALPGWTFAVDTLFPRHL